MTRLRKVLEVTANVFVLGVLGAALLNSSSVQEWVKRHAARELIRASWSELVEDASRLDVGTGEIRIIEFSDYECPFCQSTYPEIEAFLKAHPDIGMAYRHMPLSIHRRAEGAARAAICAENQSRFREMTQQLFESTGWREDGDWARAAVAAGVLDVGAFVDCLGSPNTKARLAADLALANKLGLRGTPSFVYQNGVHHGALTEEILITILSKDSDSGLSGALRP